MSRICLRYLEVRLRREVPGVKWHCKPVLSAPMLAGTNLPVEIQVRATRRGSPVKGSPFYLNAECLVRWGLDTSATLILNELTPTIHATQHRAGLDR